MGHQTASVGVPWRLRSLKAVPVASSKGQKGGDGAVVSWQPERRLDGRLEVVSSHPEVASSARSVAPSIHASISASLTSSPSSPDCQPHSPSPTTFAGAINAPAPTKPCFLTTAPSSTIAPCDSTRPDPARVDDALCPMVTSSPITVANLRASRAVHRADVHDVPSGCWCARRCG